MHPAFANHSSAWLISALNTAAVSQQESVHTLLACHQAVFLYAHHSINFCYSEQGKVLTGAVSKWRWASMWGREGEGCKESWMHRLWMQTGTEWAPKFRTQPLSLAAHFGLYELYGMYCLDRERQQKHHQDRYLLGRLFIQLILMSEPLSSPEILVSYAHINEPFWRRGTNLPECTLQMTTLLKQL